MAIKDLFIKTDAPAAPQTVQGVNPPVPTGVVNVPVSAPVATPSSSSITSDEKIIDTIWNKIIEENRPGPDYLELKNNVEALNDLPITDDQKITSAFKVLQKSYPNFKKDDIVKAIDFYINVVNNEKSIGLKELEQARVKSVDYVEAEIKQMQAQADDLKKQYDALQSSIAEKTVELTTAKSEIMSKNNTFLASVDAVMGVLESDKQRITSINF